MKRHAEWWCAVYSGLGSGWYGTSHRPARAQAEEVIL